MLQPMHTNLKATPSQILHQSEIKRIHLRNKIEHGTESKGFFHIRHNRHQTLALGCFNIMGEDKGKFFFVWPEIFECDCILVSEKQNLPKSFPLKFRKT